ncbi:MAG: lipopolysaccharide export system protein LptA [Bacteroidia bacterium]|jgi:lipopolysaccharide export system protein LptA
MSQTSSKKIWYPIFLLCSMIFFTNVNGQDNKTIELLGADVQEYDRSFLDAERLLGSVRFKQGTVYMDCDSAYFYRKDNRIKAYGHIYIRQRDTLNLWGDYLDYNGNTRIASVEGNVRLKDNQMDLTTNRLIYDLNNKTAFYNTGGKIKNGEDRLRSRVGRYYSRSKEFFFKDSVVLVNPEYTMKSDTLKYNAFTKIAYFYGPTYIYSAENTIFCRYGWYNTIRNTSQFSRGSWIEGKDNKLVADSMHYNRNTGIGQAFRNITLIDTIENIKIRGEYGIYYRNEKKTKISGNPLAIKYIEDDSLFLKADTLIDEIDSTGRRILSAFHDTKLHKSDMQGVSDSLVYNFTDSTISMFGEPILWTENNQITGDTIIIYRKNGQLNKMDIRSKAFIASEVIPETYNQVSGRNMDVFFKNNTLHKVHVLGNGESVYYAEDKDSTYTGVNYIICGRMIITVLDNELDDIRYFEEPSGGFYPVDQFPADKSKLSNLNWQADERPSLEQFLEQQKTQEEALPASVIDLLDSEPVEDVDLMKIKNE